ncbi:MAG: hypothetical protein AAF570_12570, partial [Bacteroidota bacterium]
KTFSFQELKLVGSHHQSNWAWCLKNGDLELKQQGEFYRLEGKWAGRAGLTRCEPGLVFLEKLNPQPKNPVAVKPKKVEPETPVDPDQPVNYGALNGREITHQREVEVGQTHLTIYVWDADKVDGDVVSLSFNGKWLLRDYPLVKTKRPIELNITPGADNRLILYAENEGKYPPNTAALTFFDGERKRNLNLSSDKRTCGALKFVVK